MAVGAGAGREVELDRPGAARVYDYLIGGELDYAVDRMFAKLELCDCWWPDGPRLTPLNQVQRCIVARKP